MESKEQRESGNKFVAVIIAVLVIAGGAFAAYKTGIIPGFGQGNKVASQLKTDIEGAHGTNIKSRILAFYQNNPNIPQQFKDSLLKNVGESVDIDFEYTDLKTSSGEGKGTVEIDAPKLTVASNDKTQKTPPMELRADKLFISRDVSDASHYFFHSEGNLDIYSDPMHSGTSSKILSISADMPYNEFKISGDMVSGYMKSTAKNVKFIEGRGNTVLATIGDVYMESERKKNGEKLDAWGKLSYKNIIPGDMIKLMLGAIEPLNINFDYTYKGDDYNQQLMKLMEYPQAQQTEQLKAAQDPNYKPVPVTPSEFKPFDGAAKLNDFSIMMGNAGFAVKADLTFSKDNVKIIPTGNASLKIAQYQKLIDYFNKFSRLPQDKIDNSVKFLSEIGQNANGDILIDIKLDGTENILLGGKNMDQIKAIEQKYYPAIVVPKSPAITSPDSVQAAPPVPVVAKPMMENQTKI